MRQLQMTQRPTRIRVIDALKVAFQEIRPLRREDDRRYALLCGAQSGRTGDDAKVLLARHASTRSNANSAYSYSSPGAGSRYGWMRPSDATWFVGPSETTAQQITAIPP